MYAKNLSNEEMTKIKVVDLDEFKNFYIHDFYILNHILFRNIVSSCHFSKFKFYIIQTKSHDKITKIKVVHLYEFYNFYIDDFFS